MNDKASEETIAVSLSKRMLTFWGPFVIVALLCLVQPYFFLFLHTFPAGILSLFLSRSGALDLFEVCLVAGYGIYLAFLIAFCTITAKRAYIRCAIIFAIVFAMNLGGCALTLREISGIH